MSCLSKTKKDHVLYYLEHEEKKLNKNGSTVYLLPLEVFGKGFQEMSPEKDWRVYDQE